MICPLCAGTDQVERFAVAGYSIAVCQGCGVGLTLPFPDPETSAAVNSTIYQVENRIAAYLNLRKDLERRYRRQLTRIAALKPSGRLLDVGCSIGLFVNQANLMGFHAEGVELNQTCAQFGARNFGLTIHAALPEPGGGFDGTYDVVTLFDVLEHVTNPLQFLASISRLIKPGGLLVVQAPNLDSLMAAVLRDKWAWLCPPDHLYHFSASTLPALLAKAGFSVTKVHTWEPPRVFAGNLLEALVPEAFPGNLVRKLVRFSRVLEIPIFLLHLFWCRRLKDGLVVVEATPE